MVDQIKLKTVLMQKRKTQKWLREFASVPRSRFFAVMAGKKGAYLTTTEVAAIKNGLELNNDEFIEIFFAHEVSKNETR